MLERRKTPGERLFVGVKNQTFRGTFDDQVSSLHLTCCSAQSEDVLSVDRVCRA